MPTTARAATTLARTPCAGQNERHAVEFATADTYIIGDTPHDIECGKVIGAKTIGVATGRYSVAELAAHTPTAVFKDFSDLTAFLRVIDAG